MLYSATYSSPLGNITAAGNDDGIVGLWFDGQKYFMRTITEKLTPKEDLTIFLQTKKWLDRYFAGEKPSPKELPLAPAGTPFQQNVWRHLCMIPYGETTTYGEIAKKVAKDMKKNSMSAQAVGGAVSRNPISIVIPCHRVIGSDGSLTGYAGGLDKKIALLALEGVNI